MGIYSYNKYDSEKGIFQFLQEEGFSPVLMAFGMAPDYLRREQNLIVLRLGTDMQEAQRSFVATSGRSTMKPRQGNCGAYSIRR